MKATRVRVNADGTETRSKSKAELPKYTVWDVNGSKTEAYPNTNIPTFLPAPLTTLSVIRGGKAAPKIKKSSYRPNYQGSGYLMRFLTQESMEEGIKLAVRALKTRLAIDPDDFDAIAFTGMSGALFAPPIARRLGKSLIMVRKKDDISTHSNWDVEGDYGARKYIIVDDLRSSGDTEKYIRKMVYDRIGPARYVGMLTAEELHVKAVDHFVGTGKPFELLSPMPVNGLPTVEDL